MPYVDIIQKDFEDVLDKHGYKWKLVPDHMAKENIYLIESDGVHVKIFSSIVDGVSRGVGTDAIRTICWDPVSNFPVVSSEARVYRTDNWRSNFIQRIEDIKLKMLYIEKCKICGGVYCRKNQ